MNCRRFVFAICFWLGLLGGVQAKEIVHHGPVLDIQIQRGEELLSIFQVPRLQRGDRFLVKPDMGSLPKGDWVLLLARLSPTGNQIETRRYDLSHFADYAAIDMTEDDQIPVLMLAPQLRNLFGLYASFGESADFLQEVLKSDPQRFYELQKVDQVNQAITALGQGLDQMLISRAPEQAMAAAKELAFKFGVQSLDPECFKSGLVNMQCVASNIVASKDFVLPGNAELDTMVGQKKAADLTSFLTANIQVLSQAGDFMSHKYRDQYDFAPTFGRQKSDTRLTQLFSLARFRNGSIKTAYVYVPGWFSGPSPRLSFADRSPLCWLNGTLDVRTQGLLPVVNYWHDWNLTASDPDTRERIGQTAKVTFHHERGVLQFQPFAIPVERWPRSNQLDIRLSGRFGFEFVTTLSRQMALPLSGDLRTLLHVPGDQLIAGEQPVLVLGTQSTSACVESLELSAQGQSLGHSAEGRANALVADLRQIPPGPATLSVKQQGRPTQRVDLLILNYRAQIRTVEHAELDSALSITGEHLDRIAYVMLDGHRCEPREIQEASNATDQLLLSCQGDIRFNARLSDLVTVHHKGGEPGPLKVSLVKKPAPPRVKVADHPQALLIRPSVKALQWGLLPNDRLMSDDSGLSLLLQAEEGYHLPKGGYVLQLRFVDDPRTAQSPLEHSLIADFSHMELRTRDPIVFRGVELPSVVNPLEYRVVHQPSGAMGQWRALNRSALLLPDLKSFSCASTPGKLWIHGQQLDKVDGVGLSPDPTDPTQIDEPLPPAIVEACEDGLCLLVPPIPATRSLRIALRWVDQRVFNFKPVDTPACQP